MKSGTCNCNLGKIYLLPMMDNRETKDKHRTNQQDPRQNQQTLFLIIYNTSTTAATANLVGTHQRR